MKMLYALIFQIGILCLIGAWLYSKFYNRYGSGGRLSIKQIWKKLPLQNWGVGLMGFYLGGYAYLRAEQAFVIRDSAGPLIICLVAFAGAFAIAAMVTSILLQQLTNGRGINTAQSIRLSFLTGVIVLYGFSAIRFVKMNSTTQTAQNQEAKTPPIRAYQAKPGEVPPYLTVTEKNQIVTVKNNLKATVWVRIFVRPTLGSGPSCTLRNSNDSNTSNQQSYSSFIKPNEEAQFYRMTCPSDLDAPLRLFVDSEGIPLFETND